jgi:hypothetical protein
LRLVTTVQHQSGEAAVLYLLAFSTLGAGSNGEDRLLTPLRGLSVERFRFERSHKVESFRKLLAAIRRTRPSLAIMEGTGLAGGGAS